MNGSPPPKLTWKTPAVCSCSTRSSASAVESSPCGRLTRRREAVTAAEVAGQRDFPGQIYRGAHPHFNIFIAHGEILFPGVALRISAMPSSWSDSPGGKFVPAPDGPEEVGGEKGAGCGEEKARSPAVVKQETEPLLPRAAGGMQLYACRSHLSTPRRCRRLRVLQPGFPPGYGALRYMFRCFFLSSMFFSFLFFLCISL